MPRATFLVLAATTAILALSPGVAGATVVLKAEYLFNNSLESTIAGAPTLTLVDPQGHSGFTTDTVFGESRTVFNFQSSSSTPSNQAGLVFDNSGGLVPTNNYSVQMIFKLTQGTNT